MILRYFFTREYSAWQSGFAGAITYALMTSRYFAAVVIFVIAVIGSVAGELALEKQELRA